MAINADILRTRFGFNDPNVIEGILRDPGQVARYEREYQGIINPQPAPTPVQPVQDFQAEQRARTGEFFGRLQAVPEQLEAVRTAMNIPQAFKTFGALGEQARGIAGTVRDLPQSVQQALAGQGVSSGQIAGRQASEIRGLQPAIESATRGLETGGATLENLLREFTGRTQATFAPFEIEANMLNASSQQEFDLYKTQIESDLDRELAQISRQTTLDVAQIQKATQLAQLEDKYAGISFQDLGNRLGIFKGTEMVGEQAKGKLGTLADGW